MKITGLDHLVITTQNIDKCIAFYEGGWACGMR